jgi:hypothetical protein
VLDEDGARVEQVEAPSLRVLMRSRSRLSRDHGNITAGRRRVRQTVGHWKDETTTASRQPARDAAEPAFTRTATG